MKKALVLCVDDQKILLDILKFLLKQELPHDYVCEFAQDGYEALEILDEYANQSEIETMILISDWLMPDMKGDELLIRAYKKYPNIINIMLTGQINQPGAKRAVTEANLYKCIAKPWDKAELISTIKNAASLK